MPPLSGCWNLRNGNVSVFGLDDLYLMDTFYRDALSVLRIKILLHVNELTGRNWFLPVVATGLIGYSGRSLCRYTI